MNNDCLQAKDWLPLWADSSLPASDVEWLDAHWSRCPACRADRERFHAFDTRLLSYGEEFAPATTPPAAYARLLRRMDNATSRRRFAWLIPAAVLSATAAVLVIFHAVPAHHTAARIDLAAAMEEAGFVPVPYVPPIASYERATVVSTQIPVADLQAEGYAIAADPSATVQADLLLGEDGRLHAVRLHGNRLLETAGE